MKWRKSQTGSTVKGRDDATIRKYSLQDISSHKQRYAIATYTGAQSLALKARIYKRASRGDLSGLSRYSGAIVLIEFGSAMGNFTVRGEKGDKSFFVSLRDVMVKGEAITRGVRVTVYYDALLKTGGEPEAVVVETVAK